MHALTEEDREVMQRNIRNGTRFAIPASLFFVLLGAGISSLFWADAMEDLKYVAGIFAGMMFSGIGVAACVFIVKALRVQRAELLAGVKTVLSGRVTDKRITDSKKLGDSEGAHLRSDNIRRWYLKVEEDEFEVEKLVYDRCELGSRVAVHLTPETRLLLRVEALE